MIMELQHISVQERALEICVLQFNDFVTLSLIKLLNFSYLLLTIGEVWCWVRVYFMISRFVIMYFMYL